MFRLILAMMSVVPSVLRLGPLLAEEDLRCILTEALGLFHFSQPYLCVGGDSSCPNP